MSDGSDSYRYGFNGKENDFEPKNGQGSQQDYGMRIYDPRLGKFLSVDPITSEYPMLTPYQFASNMPINSIDLDGEESKVIIVNYKNDGKVTAIKTMTYEEMKGKGQLYGHLGGGTIFYYYNIDTKKMDPETTYIPPAPPNRTGLEIFANFLDKVTPDAGSSNSYEYEGVKGMDKGADLLDKEASVMNATGVGAPVGKALSGLALILHTSHDFLSKDKKEASKRLLVRFLFLYATNEASSKIDKTSGSLLKKESKKLVVDQAADKGQNEVLKIVSPDKKDSKDNKDE